MTWALEMLNAGFNFLVPKNRILFIKETGSSPIKRLIKQAKIENRIVDGTHGRKTKSILFLDNGYVLLSAISAPALCGRMQENMASKFTEENYRQNL